MSELTQTLKILVTRYPGTMAELARKASIDRSTLYKIVSGQRTPREFQLEHLADALELSEEQRSALLLQYKQRGRGPDPRLRAELHHLLEVSFRVEDFTHREGLVSNEAASQLRCSEQYIEGSRAVAAAVASLVANHILSGDTRPLLLSPFTNPTLDHVLVERFSAADGAPVTLSQLLIYAENRDIPREWVSGVSVLTRTLPFLFLPKLNYEESEALCKTILEVGKKWVSPPYNADGWRLDVAADLGHSPAFNHQFWRDFRAAVKEANPEAVMIAEHYGSPYDWLKGDQWDTVMNYPFYLNMIDLLADEKIHVSQFVQNLGYLKGRLNKKCYPLMWNLIDSHDTARFLHLCHDNKKKQHLAAAFQLLLPGMPMVYYGDEYAMPGANDPDCRRGMYWDEEYQDKEMYNWYKKLMQVRKTHACIVEGEMIETIANDDEDTIVMIRKNGEETIAMLFNCGNSAKEFNEYAGKHNLLTDSAFDGKVDGLDAAVIVL